ncbi:MAG: YicC family protein [Lachnospiraceae bacterium]|nr:YicC family protein [Lachnospiraceae bacterium]MBQ6364393.1 YicC family protein [Lachnospiraceae bacterium]MBQ6635390.1 YicC family protein [Lachnospiraceae bacterium]MBR2995187.1 YicC family protein [Lachnospiraceae bacterium]
MIRSMTGYGRSELVRGDLKFTVEMKSVNNRYLDISIKMPRQLNPFESAIKAELKKYMQRGKVDVFISLEDLAESNVTIRYNRTVAQQYLDHLRQMAEDFGLENDIKVSALSRYPDVLTMEEESPDTSDYWEPLREAIDLAAQQFYEARTREGGFLRDDLLAKLDEMQENVEFITQRAPVIVETYRRQLYEKVSDLLQGTAIDEGRILEEVTIYSDKVCVDEELVRLRSHIEAVRTELSGDEGVGRKLDFIAQEMNRESNTILSKSDDLAVSDRAIELKTCVEKIREQIQNIE